MPSLESLPGDQRAVLQLVLGRGRSYEQIATMLSIDASAVRARALAALDALGPATSVAPENLARISDYLLGQLPASDTGAVRDLLIDSPADRAWARVISSEIAPLAAGALPEIPTERSDDGSPGAEAPVYVPESSDAPVVSSESRSPAADTRPPADRTTTRAFPTVSGPAARAAAATGATPPPADPPASERASGGGGGRRSSRRGGIIILAVGLIAVIVIVIALLSSGGSSPRKAASTPATASTSTTTPTTTSGSTTTGSTTTGAKVLAQINLSPPSGSSAPKAAGIAEVLNEGTADGVAIVAQNMPANVANHNAYAVWLYNSATDAKILGFVNPGVGKTGRLSTAGGLPTNASHYKQLIVTLETSGSPKQPGSIVLQGALSGVS